MNSIPIYTILGGLLTTFVLSRLVSYLLNKWGIGTGKIVASHGVSLAICTVIAGFGMADGGSFAWEKALSTYFLPQLFWFGFDIWHDRRKTKVSAAAPRNEQAADRTISKRRFKTVSEMALVVGVGLSAMIGAKYLFEEVLLNPSLDEEIAKASASINRDLPLSIDDVTRLEKTTSEGSILQYHYTILLTADILEAKAFSSRMSSQLETLVCSNDTMFDILNLGGGYRYTYVYETGQPLFDTTISKADCVK